VAAAAEADPDSSPATAPVSDDDPNAKQSVIYETATVRERPLSTATASVTVLGRDEIEALGVQTVAELLRFIPGLDVTSNGPRGGFSTAQIQGGDPNFTMVLLDGVPLNDSTDQYGGAVNLNSLATPHVERIEVVRGPVSSAYGSVGMSGAINIITRRGDSDRPRVRFDVAGGNASTAQATVSVAQGNEKRDYFIGASWQQEEDRVVEDSFEQLSVDGNMRYSFGPGTIFRLNGRVTSWEGEDYPESSGGPIYGNGELQKTEHDEASLAAELELGQSRPHKISATVYHHELARDNPGVPADPSNQFKFLPAFTEETRYDRVKLGWSFQVLQSKANRLDVGVELDHEDGRNDSVLDLGFPFDGSFDLDRFTGATFVEWIAERGRVVYELGARVDVPDEVDPEVSPRAGISYRFRGDATRIRLSVGRAFKLPSFFALGSPLVGDPELVPEISLGGDVSVEHRFAAADVTTSLGVFYYRFDELIDFDSEVFQLVNRDEVESKGAELTVAWTPSSDFSLKANVTNQDVEDLTTSEQLKRRPEWVGGLRLTWQPHARVRWEVDGQWVSSQSDEDQIPAPDVTTIPGYQLYGTALSFTVARAWELYGRVDNLADKEYQTLVGFPGAGLGYRLGLRFRSD